VTEALQVAPWSLTSLNCTGGTSSTVTTTGSSGREASITLAGGEHITCTFTNTASATVQWNFGAFVTADYPHTVHFESLEPRRSGGCEVWDYTAYSRQFGDQSSNWGFLTLCGITGENGQWELKAPPSDGKDYYVRVYVDNGSSVTQPGILLSGDKGATCTPWEWVALLGWTSYCSIVLPTTTITGSLGS